MPKGRKQEEADNEVIEIDADVDVTDAPLTSATSLVEEAAPSYLVELAKSGRAECKKCDEKIDNKTIRIGVIVEGEWGLFTRWQHLHCTVFHKSLEGVDKIDGYTILSKEDQAKVLARFEESKNEVDDDATPIDPDEIIRKTWEKPLEPCSDLLMPLLPYQKEGLGWLVNQELNDVHGGILADEMGMGKTIQAISLMLHNRPNPQDSELEKVWATSDQSHGAEGKLPRAGTLIVLPTVAIRQWQLEILRFTREKSLTVKVYHGADRNAGIDDILSYDVLITSFKVLEIEYRKATAGTKVTCRICGRKFYPEKLRVHRKYFCGETAQRTEAQARTQKKKARVGTTSAMDETEDEDEEDEEDEPMEKKGRKRKSGGKKDSTPKRRKLNSGSKLEDSDEEDEVAKQKKAIKAAKKKTLMKTKSPAPSKVRGKEKEEAMYWEESSEDEVARQKKAIKAAKGMAAKKPTVSVKVTPMKGKRAEAIEEESSSEDEVAKQKKAIKAAKEKAEKKKSVMKQGKKGRKRQEEESEDEVSRQKKAIKEAKEKAMKKATTKANKKPPVKKLESIESSSESSEDNERSIGVKGSKKSPAAKGKGKKVLKKKKSIEDSSSSSDSDSDYSQEESISDTDSSVSLSEESLLPPSVNKAKGAKGVKSTPTPKKQKKDKKEVKKRMKDEKEEEEESESGAGDGDEPDSEVERDIAEALKQHAKQTRKSGVNRSPLHEVSWFRVILDEAHLIKDRSTSTAKSVFNLVSLNKWCLTGTPLQNRVGELYSLIRFLRIDPHAYYYCRSKACGCKSLHYRFTKSMCDECGHSVIQHYCYFNKHILNPIKRSGYVAEGRKAMLKLKQQVLDEILLRRTKTSRADDIQLPMRVVKVRQERLDEREEDFYQALYTQSQAQFNTYMQTGTVLNNYAHIFDILIRLRQAVDHPYLVIHSDVQSTTQTYNAANNNAKEAEKGVCDLCKEPADSPCYAACGHQFCSECIENYVGTVDGSQQVNGKVKCPECDQALTITLDSKQKANGISGSVWDADKHRKKSILNKIDLTKFQSSTKMEALMEELFIMERDEYGCKAIVFSQFVNMLDLLEYRIQLGGIKCVKLLGSLSLEQRDKAIRAFKEDPDVKVLLISLKAGGVALNLTVANRIFLMDPWWNPAAEMQAIDRTHRIGQFRPIVATRFIIENSIEERILRLQEKKKLVFDGTVGGDSGSMSKLTVDDMRFLFQ